MMKRAAERLAEDLSGDLSEDEIKRVIDLHNKELDRLGNKYDAQKDRQNAELMEKLAKRRAMKEAALREKHEQIVSWFYFILNKLFTFVY